MLVDARAALPRADPDRRHPAWSLATLLNSRGGIRLRVRADRERSRAHVPDGAADRARHREGAARVRQHGVPAGALRRSRRRTPAAAADLPPSGGSPSRSPARRRPPSRRRARSARCSRSCSTRPRSTSPTAVTAAMAMRMLSSRLVRRSRAASASSSSPSMFLDDYHDFLELGAGGAAPSRAGDRADRRAPIRAASAFDGVSASRIPARRAAVARRHLARDRARARSSRSSARTARARPRCQADLPALRARRRARPLERRRRRATLGRDAVARRHDGDLPGLLPLPPDGAGEHRARPRRSRRRELEDAIAAARRTAARTTSSRRCRTATRRGSGCEFDGGHELSIGQWQRLALARAFFRGGSFLILDEPTASLDPRAESELFAQMRELAAGPLGAARLAPLLERALRRPDLRAARGPDRRVRLPRRARSRRAATSRSWRASGVGALCRPRV